MGSLFLPILRRAVGKSGGKKELKAKVALIRHFLGNPHGKNGGMLVTWKEKGRTNKAGKEGEKSGYTGIY